MDSHLRRQINANFRIRVTDVYGKTYLVGAGRLYTFIGHQRAISLCERVLTSTVDRPTKKYKNSFKIEFCNKNA